MKKKALAWSFLAHMVVLFFIIVAVTFARKDFDFVLNGIISAVYMGGLILYSMILLAVLTQNKTARIILVWIPVFAYIGIIFFLSSIPDIGFVTRLSEMDPRKFSLHVLEYMVFGFLLFSAQVNSGMSLRKAFVLTLLIGLILGYADERYQLTVPNRKFNPYDILSDFVGALVGALVVALRRGFK